ncbi:MAG: helix-turn-helix domain-containing protein [Parvibaculum sp.]
MRWDELGSETCSVARTLSVIGDRWTLMILRDCFMGVRRFEAFEASLGITRHVLSDRLQKLVSEDVLRKEPYGEAPVRYQYRLTEKGFDLYPVIMSIVYWGDSHQADARGAPIIHHHKTCGHQMHGTLVCSECGEPLDARSVEALPGPGFTRPARKPKRARPS